MDITRLTRQSHRRDRPGLRLLDRFDLAGGRAHEFCGPARRRLALWLARGGAQSAPLLWIRPSWHPDHLHMGGICAEVDPARLLVVEVERSQDLLWVMEEALRSGQLDLVVADLPEPPGLTPVRRLHLAAEAGAGDGRTAPLGLLLTPGDGGAAGVDSRWSLRPAHGLGERGGWTLHRLRARTAPPGDWLVETGPDNAPKIAERATPPSEPALA